MRRIAATLILTLGLTGNTATAAEISREQCNAILDAFVHLVEYSLSRSRGDAAIAQMQVDTMVKVAGHVADGEMSEEAKETILAFSDEVLANIGDENHSYDDSLVDKGQDALIAVCAQ